MPTISDRFGAWDTAGCKEIASSNGRKDCECRQLGHFGILFVSLYLHGNEINEITTFYAPHGYRI